MSVALRNLFRAAPAKSSLLSVAPLALAVAQLVNSYVNGLSPVAAVAFAVAMAGFAVVATGHSAAEHRVRRLERDLDAGATRAGGRRLVDRGDRS